MGSVEYGAKQAIENCLKLKKDEKLVIITDRETLKIGDSFKQAARKITSNIELYILEDFGKRPEDGITPLKCPEEILGAMATTDASIYCAQAKKNEVESLRMPMIEVIKRRAKTRSIRHAHMPSINQKIMETGMSADYAEIQRISKKVYDIATKAKEIIVTTGLGTNLTIKPDPEDWHDSNGDIGSQETCWGNLPAGEVFTTPISVEGHVIIDGCLGDYFAAKYKSIEKTPVEMDIKDGRIVKGSVKCANKQLEKELVDYIFNTDKNSSRIGELGIGTNIALLEIIGNLLQDEKFPGVHIAWGSPVPGKSKAKWKSKVHCDGVIRNTTIIVDGETIMEKGKYLI